VAILTQIGVISGAARPTKDARLLRAGAALRKLKTSGSGLHLAQVLAAELVAASAGALEQLLGAGALACERVRRG
jgi:hypothetical protein